jgi:succinyl-diaminopimelate desuccinylase
MGYSAAVELARQLIRVDTTNPSGNETRAARLIADRLRHLDVSVELHELSPGRESLIARHVGLRPGPALCLSGHLDTVPIGAVPWSRDPFAGEIDGDRLWGRGSTDMKGGIAAMVVAFERLSARNASAPVTLALTASEETGCQGAASIVDKIGAVGALVIAEPTSESAAISHKGVLWLRLRALGKAAHGSKPELGENAIDRLIAGLAAIRGVVLEATAHPVMGPVTANVGTIAGGVATNIVPDSCEATLDLRIVPGFDAREALRVIRSRVGYSINVEPILSLDAVESSAADPWLNSVVADANHVCGTHRSTGSAAFFTDASVLVPALGYPPVAIIGPGNPALAHQVDEWCSVGAIDRAVELYERLGLNWRPNVQFVNRIQES